jgi:hypothetical protein
MNIDATKVITGIDGKPFTEEGDKNLTIRTVCVAALMNVEANEGTGEEKLKRYILAIKIHEAEQMVEVAAEDISLIKKLIGKGYGPAIVGPVFLILENKENVK